MERKENKTRPSHKWPGQRGPTNQTRLHEPPWPTSTAEEAEEAEEFLLL